MYKTKFSKEFEKLHEGYILDKRYRITRLIGEGGFGITYEAENIHSGKRVAVKANCQGDPQKFLQEARTLRDFSEESATATGGTSRDSLKLCRRKRKLSELFSASTKLETAWKLFKAIYSTERFLLPLEKRNGAEMC